MDNLLHSEGLSAALLGAFSSLIAQTLANPLDIVRTRRMALTLDRVNVNVNQALLSLWRAEGGEGLLRGMKAKSFRAVCSGAIQFASYEISQQMLRK